MEPQTGAHFNAVEGGKAHRGVDYFAVFDSGDGGAVADVAGYYLRAFGSAEDFAHFTGYIAVGGAVRAVASYRVLFVHFVRDRVHPRVVGHGLVEGGVEDEDLRDARESVGDALDAHEVSAGVKGREVAALFELFDDFGGDLDRLGEERATVDYSVSDGFDFVHRLDAAVVSRREGVDEDLGRDRVVRHGELGDVVFSAGHFVGDLTVDTDALADALCYYFVCSGVEELILERRAAGVDD